MIFQINLVPDRSQILEGGDDMAYEYTNAKGTKYYLHRREVTLRGSGKVQRIYFFAKEPKDGAIDEIPEGYTVVENPRTGLPILKRA
ncbi:MAG: hypothetical protein US86_C0003G0017 [Candidatus Daviesbacteria bacterium GW2011_GWA2_38_24]|uniref:Uncharacterized protein n=1 Tax=Candidatus Daviesbacteria bacterium GW2011_GWA2_38_24 TaxID=1618422 RepID=A0A0G0LZH4_9BACT|nr:MAG: hypothetical protein US86_C0003G0017 [Candidatus Daviesbacteria bacterium GW2011_GWA2_38_24]